MPDSPVSAAVALSALALLLKLALVAFASLRWGPVPISAEGWHCYRLLVQPSAVVGWRFRLRAAGRTPWLAASVVFLLLVTEFTIFPKLPVRAAMAGLAAVLAVPFTVLMLTRAGAPFYARRNGC